MAKNSTITPAQLDDFHPVLKSMRTTCERIFERGDDERAFPLLHAIIVLNSKPSFRQGHDGQ